MPLAPRTPPPLRRAVVAGAGPAGLAAAVALRRLGVETLVFERKDSSQEGVGLTLWPNAFRALATFGAARAVLAAGWPAGGNAMHNAAGAQLSFLSRAALEQRFGSSGVTLHRAELTAALFGLLAPDTVTWGVGCEAFSDHGDGVTVRLSDGEEVEADLVVGADGFHSTVRAGVSSRDRIRYAGFTVLRGVTPYDAPDHPGTLSLGPGEQFGLFPMSGGRVYWFASVPSARPMEPLDARGRAEVMDRFRGWHDPIPGVLAASSPAEVVATDIWDRAAAEPRVRGRVALVGDAARPLMPNLGQGTCQAFEDVAVLAACLARGDEVDGALRAYAAARRRRTRWIAAQTRQLAMLGRMRGRTVCWVRDQMIRRMPEGPSLRRLERVFRFEPPASPAPVGGRRGG